MTTSPSDIPDAAVIAASKALMADKMSNHSGDNAPQIMDACEKVARKVLEAAAPFLLGYQSASRAGAEWEDCPKRHASPVQHALDCGPREGPR